MGLYVPKLLLLLFKRSLTNGACSFLPSRTSHSSKRACPTACTETTTRTSHLPCLPNPFVPMAASETLFSKPSTWNCESHHDACASNALRFRCKLSNSDKKRAARPQDKGFQLEMGRPSGFHVLRLFLYSGCFNLASGADRLRFLCYVYIYTNICVCCSETIQCSLTLCSRFHLVRVPVARRQAVSYMGAGKRLKISHHNLPHAGHAVSSQRVGPISCLRKRQYRAILCLTPSKSRPIFKP